MKIDKEGYILAKDRFIKLSPLQQSLYVLDALEKGMTKDQIVQSFDGDKELVSVWMDFIKSMNWLEKNNVKTVLTVDSFTVTDAGKHALEKYSKQNL